MSFKALSFFLFLTQLVGIFILSSQSWIAISIYLIVDGFAIFFVSSLTGSYPSLSWLSVFFEFMLTLTMVLILFITAQALKYLGMVGQNLDSLWESDELNSLDGFSPFHSLFQGQIDYAISWPFWLAIIMAFFPLFAKGFIIYLGRR